MKKEQKTQFPGGTMVGLNELPDAEEGALHEQDRTLLERQLNALRLQEEETQRMLAEGAQLEAKFEAQRDSGPLRASTWKDQADFRSDPRESCADYVPFFSSLPAKDDDEGLDSLSISVEPSGSNPSKTASNSRTPSVGFQFLDRLAGSLRLSGDHTALMPYFSMTTERRSSSGVLPMDCLDAGDCGLQKYFQRESSSGPRNRLSSGQRPPRWSGSMSDVLGGGSASSARNSFSGSGSLIIPEVALGARGSLNGSVSPLGVGFVTPLTSPVYVGLYGCDGSSSRIDSRRGSNDLMSFASKT
jgi:hypothetical protein